MRLSWAFKVSWAAGAVVLLAGCGSTKVITQTNTVFKTTTTTVSHTTTVTKVKHGPPPPPVTSTVTHTVTAPPEPAAGLSWSGNGGENIGTVHVPQDSVIQWTDDGGLFAILDDENAVEVNSEGHSGTSAISAGTYHHFQVNADGNWTIKILAQ
jgi:hypothetical protein